MFTRSEVVLAPASRLIEILNQEPLHCELKHRLLKQYIRAQQYFLALWVIHALLEGITQSNFNIVL